MDSCWIDVSPTAAGLMRRQASTVYEVIATAGELVREAQKTVAESMKLCQHSWRRRLLQLRLAGRPGKIDSSSVDVATRVRPVVSVSAVACTTDRSPLHWLSSLPRNWRWAPRADTRVHRLGVTVRESWAQMAHQGFRARPAQ
jgi:hypothetical protein